jgi:hypothetical protein
LNGKQELWKAGSKNLLAYNNDLTNWTGNCGIIKNDDWNLVTKTTSGTSESKGNLNINLPSSAVLTVSLKAGNQGALVIGLYGSLGWGGTSTARIVSGTGTLTQQAGTLWRVAGLTDTETVVEIKKTNDFSSNNGVYLYPDATDSVALGASVNVKNAQLELGSTATTYEPNPVVIQPGLLIEGAATNYCAYSTAFNSWSDFGSGCAVTADQLASPDGSITADYLNYSTNSQRSYQYNYGSSVANKTFVFSVWLQAGTLGVAKLVLALDTDQEKEEFDVTLIGGWRRYYIKKTFSNAPANNIITISVRSSTVGYLFAWGGELKEESFPTSYIPTSGAAVTRAADVATIDVSNIWNPTEGTIVAEADLGTTWNTSTRSIFWVSGPNSLYVFQASDGNLYIVFGEWAVAAAGFGIRTGRIKVAASYTNNRWSVSINGESVSTAAMSWPANKPTTVSIGCYGSTYEIGTPVQSLQYHRFAFDDKTLQHASTLK